MRFGTTLFRYSSKWLRKRMARYNRKLIKTVSNVLVKVTLFSISHKYTEVQHENGWVIGCQT